MTNLQRRVKIVQCFSISSRELHSARAAVGDMASKSGGARDRSIFTNHFFFFWPIQSCTMHSTHESPPLLGELKFIEIGFGSHSVTIFELLKHEGRYWYATFNNKSTQKQEIREMIPVLNKVIPLRSISFKIYCCFISKTLKCFIQGSNLADSWGRCPQVDWQHSSAQISVAGKISIRRMVKIFWPIRCMLLKLKF